MSLFEGVLKKSGPDINKKFRKRFCKVFWEEEDIIPRERTFSLPSYKSPNTCKQLVFTYYKHKDKKVEDYKGKFVLDNSAFIEVPSGVKEYQNVIAIKLANIHNGKNNGRVVYLCLKTEEEKKCLINVLRDNIKSSSSYISSDDDNMFYSGVYFEKYCFW
ncbi:uncharacterized protein LOC136081739 isoform X2 [Hydra vulgaris]|uniref:Uncharacterized protein LOC136081739 isoform X2 n=1 Tax=Hydra vulgaris TaxID=6087 RepID=A0ABM4C2H5_HYDVU